MQVISADGESRSADDLPERLHTELLRLGADAGVAREVADLWKNPPLREEVALEAIVRLTATLPPKETE